jgi:hypothetical protein
MGKARDIKNGLITVLQGLGATSDGTRLQQVIDNASSPYDTFPSARILPRDQTNATLQNHQNERTVSYVCWVDLQLEDSPSGESKAYDTMYDLQDLIVDGLDAASFNFGVGTLILETKVSAFEVTADSKVGAILSMRIDIDARYSKDV